ncbi:hypothetical protein AGDE_15924 [Angomonas deanei]|uniref:Protein kinase domain containing protein n=1 Tax=Angomonas deanei TaxID=59799 RepID=A0A7G2CWP1_9TRYP|nr:hypothetical protein AGDE_15924 [Angomonas deanei]CAD2222682.1 hypothetical protein, conserved [Angomonas deanei]|eukprot:EPY18136.1 hypothetical protein AGDE_15924 [Angomonas deanei]
MKHPFLIELHQAFQSRTHLYLVLDFAQGGDLYYFDNKKLWLKRLKRVLTKFEYPYYVKRGAAFTHSSAHSHSESLADTNLLMGESTASRKGVGHRKGNPKIHGSTDNVSTTRRRVRKKSVSLHGEKKKLSMEQEHDSPLAGGESHLMPLAERKSSTMGNFGDDENENSNTHFNKEYETMSEEDDFNSGNKSFFGETIPKLKIVFVCSYKNVCTCHPRRINGC